jgi:hypothetical protein
MAKDINDGTTVAATIDTTSTALSAQAFANPADFLQVLKNDYYGIAQTDPNNIYKSDLIAYSENGSDPQGRAAAKIAAAHYDDLQAFANNALKQTPGPLGGISANDLQTDIDLMHGNVQSSLASTDFVDAGKIVMGTLATGVATAGAISTFVECPPLGTLLGGTALIAGAVAFQGAKDAYTASGRLKAQSTTDQQVVNSWLNAGGGQTGSPNVQQQIGAKPASPV